MRLSEWIVTLAKDYSLLFEGKVRWTQRKDMVSTWVKIAKNVEAYERTIVAAAHLADYFASTGLKAGIKPPFPPHLLERVNVVNDALTAPEVQELLEADGE